MWVAYDDDSYFTDVKNEFKTSDLSMKSHSYEGKAEIQTKAKSFALGDYSPFR